MSVMPKPWKHPKTGIYYHRIDVPKDIRHIIGKTTIKKSLGTRNFNEAKKAFVPLHAQTQTLFEQARQTTKLTYNDIEVLAHRWLKKVSYEAPSREVVDNKQERYAEFVVYCGDEYESCRPLVHDALDSGYEKQLKWAGHHVDALLSDNNLLIPKASPSYRALVERICFCIADFSDVCVARITKNNFGYIPYNFYYRANELLSTEDSSTTLAAEVIGNTPNTIAPEISPTLQTPAKGNFKPLKDVIKSYIDYKTQRGDWDAKTLADVEGVCGQFMEYVGANINPSTISREQFREFSVLLSKLPTNYARSSRFKGKTLLQLAEISDSEGLKTAADSTVKKKFGFIKSIFKHATQEEWVDKDRADGINIAIGEVQQRLPFLHEQLVTLFKATSDAEKASSYWMPRIGLTTGMRSNEILQLTKKDIRQVGGIWVFDINKDFDSETGRAKKVKRDNSKRLIPVPDILIRAGFIGYVEALPVGRIFPCVSLGTDGTYSATYSKVFNSLLKELRLKPPASSRDKLDFHSLRHTFRANCRAFGVPSEMADLIGGWSDQTQRTSGDKYGVHFESFIQELKRCIDLIDYGSLFS